MKQLYRVFIFLVLLLFWYNCFHTIKKYIKKTIQYLPLQNRRGDCLLGSQQSILIGSRWSRRCQQPAKVTANACCVKFCRSIHVVASNARVFVVEWVAGIAGGACPRHRAQWSVGSRQKEVVATVWWCNQSDLNFVLKTPRYPQIKTFFLCGRHAQCDRPRFGLVDFLPCCCFVF